MPEIVLDPHTCRWVHSKFWI